MSIPANIQTVRTNGPLTAAKMTELMALRPSFVIMGMKEIRVFFLAKNVVGVYTGAGTNDREVMNVMDGCGFRLYHGDVAALAGRGLSRRPIGRTLEWLKGRKSFGMTYVAKDGEVSTRVVREWKQTSPRHIVGWCSRANDERTFLLESICELWEVEEQP
jgi:hypothetical protein